MDDKVRSKANCEERCEAVAEKCLSDIFDTGSCQIKYNRCRIACSETE